MLACPLAFTCIRGVAGAGCVALVVGSADDRVAAAARASRAGVRLGAGVAIIAGRGVCLGKAIVVFIRWGPRRLEDK